MALRSKSIVHKDLACAWCQFLRMAGLCTEAFMCVGVFVLLFWGAVDQSKEMSSTVPLIERKGQSGLSTGAPVTSYGSINSGAWHDDEWC